MLQNTRPPSSSFGLFHVSRSVRLLPGVALCFGLTFVAMAVQIAEENAIGHPYVEALVIAILIGMIIRGVWTPSRRWQVGIAFSAKQLLEVAVMLLGASISLSALVASGPLLLGAIVTAVFVTIGVSFGISRLLGLPTRMSLLIACGNSICGNSAIAAVAPVINASSDDIVSSISFTAILGVLMVLGLPLLIPLLHFTAAQYGILAGLTVYAVPQVLGGDRAGGARQHADRHPGEAGPRADARSGRRDVLSLIAPRLAARARVPTAFSRIRCGRTAGPLKRRNSTSSSSCPGSSSVFSRSPSCARSVCRAGCGHHAPYQDRRAC